RRRDLLVGERDHVLPAGHIQAPFRIREVVLYVDDDERRSGSVDDRRYHLLREAYARGRLRQGTGRLLPSDLCYRGAGSGTDGLGEEPRGRPSRGGLRGRGCRGGRDDLVVPSPSKTASTRSSSRFL